LLKEKKQKKHGFKLGQCTHYRRPPPLKLRENHTLEKWKSFWNKCF